MHTRLACQSLTLFVLLTACAVRPAPTPLNIPTFTAPPAQPPPTSTPTPIPTAAATATPAPVELIVCQSGEPASLYLYGDDVAARASIFDTLFDGPIDSVGYAYQPVILEKLPNVEDGSASLVEVEVSAGDTVVDAATGAVGPLAAGVQLAQLDGSRITYAGSDPARTVQVTALFTLRPDVLWSDGQPLDADDSLFSFETAANHVLNRDANASVNKFVMDRTARYEVVGTFTTRWTGLPGWVDNQFFLRFWTPLPRHLDGRLTAAQLLADAGANERPIGWGPFMLGEWTKGRSLTLVRNPYYFRAAEGLPRLDKVTFRFGMTSEHILTEMVTGKCHLGLESADFGGHLQFLLNLQAAGQLAPQFVMGTAFEHLDFGIEPAGDHRRAAGRDVFKDARVRQAIAYCLDRQTLIQQLLHGLSEAPAVYLPSAHPLYAGDQLTLYPPDPARGQALLTEAGWLDTNGDGVRDKGGRRLALDYASGPAGSPFRDALMQFVQAQLQNNCGIEVRLALYPPGELFDAWPKGVLFGRKFDLGGFPWRTGIEPPCDLYTTEAIPSYENPGGANNTGYSNPAFDQACRAAQGALDEATRRARHVEAQVIFTQDLPSLPLFFRIKAGVAAPSVSGYRLDATANSDLWNIEEISLSAP